MEVKSLIELKREVDTHTPIPNPEVFPIDNHLQMTIQFSPREKQTPLKGWLHAQQ